MDFSLLNAELGPVTVATHLINRARHCPQVLAAATRSNPFVPVFFENNRMKIGTVFKKALASIKRYCRKKALILAHQELELVELLCAHYRLIHLSVMADTTLPPDVLGRMRNNLPRQCCAEIIQIPKLPKFLQPSTAIILAVGVKAGGNWVLLPEPTLNVLEHLHRFFWGEIILLDPIGYPTHARGDGWIPIQEKKFFTGVASPNGYSDLDAVSDRRTA